jgi:hypothetical protein
VLKPPLADEGFAASAPRLPNADQLGARPTGQTWDLPVPAQGASTHARFFDPRRAVVRYAFIVSDFHRLLLVEQPWGNVQLACSQAMDAKNGAWAYGDGLARPLDWGAGKITPAATCQ